jgi:pimeloyl-ACP methyl ester carboxylesterase
VSILVLAIRLTDGGNQMKYLSLIYLDAQTLGEKEQRRLGSKRTVSWKDKKLLIVRLNILMVFAVSVLIGSVGILGQSSGKRKSDPAVALLRKGFVSNTARVNGTTLHYVRGGAGPAIVLQHGFPQDWYAWGRIMPRLAEKFTVIAVDMRGVGGSAATPASYDAATIAEDIHQLIRHLKLERVYVAGHDNGGMVAYTFARLYPRATRGVMILDSPLPGIEPWDEVKADPQLWHFGFHQTPNLPEKLIAGRQFVYFRDFFNRLALNHKAITDADVTHYVNSYASLAQLQAGLEFYRSAYPASEKFNAAQRTAIEVPIALAGGDNAVGLLIPRIADSLRKHGCTNVTTDVITNSGHWVIDEQPEIVAELIERHASL